MPLQSVTVTRQAVENLNRGEISDPALYADDVAFHTPLSGTLHGVDAVAAALEQFHVAFPDHRHTVLDEIEAGEKVTYRWRFRGTHTGDLMGIPATGKEVEMEGISVLRVADDHIAEIWEAANFFGLMQQLGVVPAGV